MRRRFRNSPLTPVFQRNIYSLELLSRGQSGSVVQEGYIDNQKLQHYSYRRSVKPNESRTKPE